MITYGFTKALALPIDKALEVTTEQLKQEGFGVLTRIDLDQKFEEKLGIDFNRYVILGACNPAFAHKSLLAEENIGLFLPCNVILYEKEGNTVLAIIKPTVAMNMIDNEQLRGLAAEVEAKLQRAFDRIN